MDYWKWADGNAAWHLQRLGPVRPRLLPAQWADSPHLHPLLNRFSRQNEATTGMALKK
jgi:hypothetical protein